MIDVTSAPNHFFNLSSKSDPAASENTRSLAHTHTAELKYWHLNEANTALVPSEAPIYLHGLLFTSRGLLFFICQCVGNVG